MRICEKLTILTLILATVGISQQAQSNPVLGKWKITDIAGDSPYKTRVERLGDSAALLKFYSEKRYSIIEFQENQILVDGKQACVNSSELYVSPEDERHYQKALAKDKNWTDRMNPSVQLKAILETCKKKGQPVNPMEFFDIPEWVIACGAGGEKPEISSTEPFSLFQIDESTMININANINICLRRLRSPTDDGNYFILEALRHYNPNRIEPASQEFLKQVKVQIPAKVPVTRGNPGNRLAKLNFKDDAGKTVTCEYKGNVPKKGPAPAQLAYEFQRCTSKNKVNDTLAAVSVQLQIINGNQSAGTTAAEISFDYVP